MRQWDEFVDLLKPAEALLDQLRAPRSEQLRAELYRQFAMNLAQGYLLYFQTSAEYPEFMPFENSAFLAQPNPDAVYYYTRVDGAGSYRVVGERGDAIVAGFAVGNRMIGMAGSPGQGLANYDIDQLEIGADGRFEVLFSAERPAGHVGNWRYLHPEADFLLVRQFNYDWGGDRDMRLAIERLDPLPPKPRLSPERTDALLGELFGTYARGLSAIALGALGRAFDKGLVNKVALHDFKDLGNSADWPQAYWEMVFELAEDEALVIESDLPEARHYWNVQVIDGLWNQADILYRQTSLNGRTARIDADGRFRAVLCRQDPGYANWLDTADHGFGMLIGRWYRCSSHPVPQVRRMKLAEVATYLGDRSARISPEARRAALRERLIGAQWRRRW
ncbi:MAG TPA: DUF1214 domain-containing protein [Novosphingobium sp.]|nr:DUF1214 domain-containing protein [Novosphingobium sp.]